MTSPRLDAQMAFLTEAEKLRTILRATPIGDGSRQENSGEHSWHIALYALILAEHAPEGVSIDRVIRMLLIHDIVEIDAGDVPIYLQSADTQSDTEAAELEAAKRIFGLLPDDQAADMLALWQEFEAAESPDAVFAKSLDRFQPPNLNLVNGGGSWKTYNVTFDELDRRVGKPVRRGAPTLWNWIAPKIRAVLR
ncbi:HD domain-containing protein [Pseudooceanicola atlanticus]|uniref:Hydrolase n=1 Tax=Pseudooceanicola atlanticus TaxID=1461694 RepID=A0A0A0EB45_9RHOB|nr:HD domain-containing protein [Pseudooceanicola atlanticus]KGM47694.1 hydrolase [Pseudooceanicola atlanticus]